MMNDMQVCDNRRFLIDIPSDHDCFIAIPRKYEDTFSMPLSLHGATSHFPTRKTTVAEWDNAKSY